MDNRSQQQSLETWQKVAFVLCVAVVCAIIGPISAWFIVGVAYMIGLAQNFSGVSLSVPTAQFHMSWVIAVGMFVGAARIYFVHKVKR